MTRRLSCLLLAALFGLSSAHAVTPPGILVVVQSLDDLVSLDPAEGFELSGQQVFTSVYERLVEADPEHPQHPMPALASAWAPGGAPNTLVFTLRPGARFASGHPVRAEDVVYSLTRAVKLNRSPAFILNELGWMPDTVDRCVTRLDATHVELRWTAAVSSSVAVSILTSPIASIVDSAEVQSHAINGDAGNLWLRRHSAGSGPFSMRRYIPHEAIVLDANPLASAGAPPLQTIVIKNVVDASTRRLLVEVGDADIARDLGPDQIDALRDVHGVRIFRTPGAAVHFLMFNAASTSNPALANPALWEAARWLIDYDGIATQLLRGSFDVHQSFLPKGFPGALEARPFRLDIARARSILARAHLDRGVRLKLEVFNQPPYPEIAQSLQATFAAGGIELEILPELASQVYDRVRRRAGEATWVYWVPDYYDANSNASAFAVNREDGTKTLAWRTGWHIPQLTRDAQAAVQEEDPARRSERYLAMQTEVQRSSPFVIALQERSAVAMRDNVTGYRQGPSANMVYYDRVRK